MSNVAYLPDERRTAILAMLARGEAVSAAKLAARFSVSEDAIRRDLRKLAGEGLCEKVYGGALPLDPAAQPFSVRAGEGRDRKDALARSALSLLKPRDCVFLDVSSTNVALAEMLPTDLELTIVTNSIPVAMTLMGRPGLKLFMLGGPVNSQVGGTIGAGTVAELQNYHFDMAFLGTCALCRKAGVSAFDSEDAEVKRAATRGSSRVAVLVAEEKLGTHQPHKVVPFERIDVLIFEDSTGDQTLRDYKTDANEVFLAGGENIRTAGPS
ncbi:DeoR/GlpR family DNA-binding transcription regulator [uncultured Roseibium sp.]|uniref:DeoR/GlpR family DNA-binding transcription regulator n=1 Tax=uncultured Roseibium sp. TaxID=1936171 RepID=UPI002620500E|nr:DeoR/GlpR family DNA-binding transcription regulator [uncultured Roseibium sp.]